MSSRTPLCTEEELVQAFRLLVTEQQAIARARAYFEMHDVTEDGYLLVDPFDWYPSHDVDDHQSFATSSSPGLLGDTPIVWIPLRWSELDVSGAAFASWNDDMNLAERAVGWAHDVKKLSDERRGSFLMSYGPFTLESLVARVVVTRSVCARLRA